jgi:transposase
MTEAEWAALRPYLARDARRGGRPADDRRRWDAVFWVACSAGPWRALPAVLGTPSGAHQTLRRAARAGLFERLLTALGPRGDRALRPLAYRLLRAFRRISRLLPLRLTLLAHWLGLATALPCRPDQLPRPDLQNRLLAEGRTAFLTGGMTPERGSLIRGLLRLARGTRRAWRTH